MAPVDVLAKLSALTDHLDGFNDDDKQFITQVLSCQETGKMLSICDITRIVGMQIPGKDPPIDAIWKEGTVTAIRKDLDKVIWRYMPIEGLFFLLSTKTLHFSPLSAMEDTNEGQLPPVRTSRRKRSCQTTFSEGRAA
jgi:hypothetical protein